MWMGGGGCVVGVCGGGGGGGGEGVGVVVVILFTFWLQNLTTITNASLSTYRFRYISNVVT